MLGITGCALTSEQPSRDKFRISKEELKDRLNDPSLIILDVRISKDWKKSGKKIKGAIQKDPNKFAEWSSQYPKTKTIVLYCA
jgi:rhodanese-related sulfurtransferase